MKRLFFECCAGVAGDMLLSSLIDLFDEKETLIQELNQIGIPEVEYKWEPSTKCGIVGSHVHVLVGGQEEESADAHDHEHCHHDEEHHDHEHCHHDEEHHDHEHCHNEEHHDHEQCHDEEHHDHEHGHHHEGHHHHGHHHGHHHHAGMKEINAIIDSLKVSDSVKHHSMEVYRLIAEAESKVHGREMDQIHFHEVGTKDAIADVVACAYLLEKIGADEIVASPIVTGYGHVHCAHGILPVPAPATALLLTGIPSLAGSEAGERSTPTGVALIKHYADSFSQRPLMTIDIIGYGMGTKDFKEANCVRAFLEDV